MNNWNEKDSFASEGANTGDGLLDNFCSMSEPDDSGHFTASPEADGCGESLVELDISPSPSRTNKEFSCSRVVSSHANVFDDDSCMSIMSAPGVLRGITKCLEKSAQSPRNSENDDSHLMNKSPKREFNSYPNTYLGEVLHDFNSMFREKLQYIDNASKNADTATKIMMMERRNEVLEQWAKDVCSQNMLLVHTVEELEEEANRKVKTLQAKINATTNLARSHMEMIQQYEKQVEELLSEQSTAQNKYELLTYQHMEVSKNYKTVQQRMKVLEDDNDGLRSLVCRIRDMGVWDVNGLQLQPRTYDLLFGLYPNLAGSEVQTVFTREKARNIIDSEVKSKEMEIYIAELKDSKREVDAALDEKQKTVISLEAEVKSLSTVLKHYQGQCDDLKKVLEETQDKLIQVTNKTNLTSVETKEELTSAMSRRDQDIKDMLNALRELKTQLNKACDERQSAIYEAKMLKRELGDRTSEMLEMRNILTIIQNEAECTRSAVQNVQDKQDHLSILKDQVHSYQEKYEQAQTLLSSKSEIIQSLQQQMSMLHEKVMHMESQTCNPITSTEQRECDQAVGNTSARNLIPSIIDNSVSAALKRFEVTAKERVAKMFEENKERKKPEWTHNFTKGSMQSSEPSSSVAKAKNTGVKSSVAKSTTIPKEGTEKSSKPGVASNKVPADKTVKKSQLNKAGNNVEKAKTERINGLRKFENLGDCKDLKLPKISLAHWMQSNDKNKKNSSPKSGGLGNERLPSLGESTAKSGNPGFKASKVPTENPMAQRSSLNNLMDVETTKSYPKESPYANSAGLASQSKARRSRSSPRNGDEKPLSQNVKSGKDKSHKDKYRSKDMSPRSKSSSAPTDAVAFSKSRLTVQNSGELNSILPPTSWVAEEMLQQLPQQSNDISVKNWIASSSKTCVELTKKMKVVRSRSLCPHSDHSSPSNSSDKSLRKRRFPPSRPLHNERHPPIYNLEDEWDKTMAKFAKRNTAMKDTYLEEPTTPRDYSKHSSYS